MKMKYIVLAILLLLIGTAYGTDEFCALPNLILGGINEADPVYSEDGTFDTDDGYNDVYEKMAIDLGAYYVPMYNNGQDADIIEVQKASYGIASEQNGLKSELLNGDDTYGTVVSYSGGTATAITALAQGKMTCDTLILISPMSAYVSSTWIDNAQGRAKLASDSVEKFGEGLEKVAEDTVKTAVDGGAAISGTDVDADVNIEFDTSGAQDFAAWAVTRGDEAGAKEQARANYEAQIKAIIKSGAVKNIVVITATDDDLYPGFSSVFQVNDFEELFGEELKKAGITLTVQSTTMNKADGPDEGTNAGEENHVALFEEYAVNHLSNTDDGKIEFNPDGNEPNLINQLSGTESPAWMKSESSSGLERTSSLEKNSIDASQSNTQGTSSAAVDAFSADTLQSPAKSQKINPTDTSQSNTQETSTAAFDAYSEGRRLAAEAFAETYQSTEASTDIAQGLEPITQSIETAKSTDESNTKESSVIPTLYPTTSSPPDESNTKESSVIPTLYPVTSSPPDESNTKESSVIPTLYPVTSPPPDEQANDLPFGSVQETTQQGKQAETLTDESDAYSEGKRLASEAFKETYQSAEQPENADSTTYKTTTPTPTGSTDESNTKEGSVIPTLYPTTSTPPDESNTKESDLGGVNFTSIKLNYISVSKDSSGGVNLDLILKAQKAKGTSPGIDIQNAARIGATAFMTGLAVHDNKFWVNLNAWDADRIIDEELGQSEVGRIMLEADLQMKRDFSNYGNPCANETGKALWSLLDKKRQALAQQCMSKFPGEIKNIDSVRFRQVTRHWIIPDKVYAYSNGTQIYIINSTLTISSEPVADHTTFELHDQDIGTLSKSCFEELNKSAKEYGEYSKEQEDRMILPYVVTEINSGKKYEDLREVYVALALAQWYKSKMTSHMDIFRDRPDSSSSAVLSSQNTWSPKEIWDNYVYSFKNGEYKCWENTTTKTAGMTHTRSHLTSAGGVEFDGIKDHLVKIEGVPHEVKDQINRAVSNGFVNQSTDILFGYRLTVDQKEETLIAATNSESSSDSLNSKKAEKTTPNDNRADNAASLINKKALGRSTETSSVAKVADNASHITCPEGWMGPDENGECWKMQITG